MAYAVLQDILDSEGEDTLYAVADRDHDGVLNAAETLAITKALDAGAGEMNSYIGQRYDLPLPVAPDWAQRINIDLAIYRLARSADALTTEIRTRYEDDIAFLKQVSKGTAGLGLAGTQEPAPAPGATSGEVKGGEILVSSNPRVFGRSNP